MFGGGGGGSWELDDGAVRNRRILFDNNDVILDDPARILTRLYVCLNVILVRDGAVGTDSRVFVDDGVLNRRTRSEAQRVEIGDRW